MKFFAPALFIAALLTFSSCKHCNHCTKVEQPTFEKPEREKQKICKGDYASETEYRVAVGELTRNGWDCIDGF